MKNSSQGYFLGLVVSASLIVFLLHHFPNGSDMYIPPKSSMFVGWYIDDATGTALVHDVGPMAEAIKRADVLIVGDSKPLFALSANLLNYAFADVGINFFNMGVGGGEGALLATKIINQLDLKNKILIVNIDSNMLAVTNLTAQYKEAIRMDWFNAMTRVYQVRARSVFETWLDHKGLLRLSFKLGKFIYAPRNEPRAYRDNETGDILEAIRDYEAPHGKYALIPDSNYETRQNESELDNQQVSNIFTSWQSRGLQLIFITVPHGQGDNGENRNISFNPGMPSAAATRFGGHAIEIPWNGVMSYDRIHVDRYGREIVTKRLIQALKSHALKIAQKKKEE